MQKLKVALLASVVSMSLAGSGSVLGWGDSFSFGDSWGEDFGKSSWSTPDWGSSYSTPSWFGGGRRPWGGPAYGGPAWGGPAWGAPSYYAPPGGYYYQPPRLDSYDRTIMKDKRQALMERHDDAMDKIADMLYGRYRFDREETLDNAKHIELDATQNMLRHFHPGAIATSGSHTAPTFFGNEAAFKANADALAAAAKALAEELQKKPGSDESALYPRKSKGFDYRPRSDTENDPVSPAIFDRFNELAGTCITCHSYYRLPDW